MEDSRRGETCSHFAAETCRYQSGDKHAPQVGVQGRGYRAHLVVPTSLVFSVASRSVRHDVPRDRATNRQPPVAKPPVTTSSVTHAGALVGVREPTSTVPACIPAITFSRQTMAEHADADVRARAQETAAK